MDEIITGDYFRPVLVANLRSTLYTVAMYETKVVHRSNFSQVGTTLGLLIGGNPRSHVIF